jgi:cytochrome c5
MHTKICPVCNGQGIVSKPPWVAGDQRQWTSSSTAFPCDVCHGFKIIYVPDDLKHEERIKELEKKLNK